MQSNDLPNLPPSPLPQENTSYSFVSDIKCLPSVCVTTFITSLSFKAEIFIENHYCNLWKVLHTEELKIYESLLSILLTNKLIRDRDSNLHNVILKNL